MDSTFFPLRVHPFSEGDVFGAKKKKKKKKKKKIANSILYLALYLITFLKTYFTAFRNVDDLSGKTL